ncbi:hypothetical protein EH30_00690 [Erythrobacter sp. JL475]|nr:hypothetical protein EH30_00690 [Erythrobacter sp. JL475]
MKEFGVDLVVPTCEEIFHLATAPMHDALGERLFAPPQETLRRLHDKLLFAQVARTWGLPTPESIAVGSAADLDQFTADSSEWVFKPRFTRFGGSTLIGPDARSLAALADAIDDGWMAQRRIRGEEASLHFIAHRGALCAFAAYGSGWRLKGGASYAFEPVSQARTELLRSLAEALARGGKLHGQFGCDVVFDKAGEAMIIECNRVRPAGYTCWLVTARWRGQSVMERRCHPEINPLPISARQWSRLACPMRLPAEGSAHGAPVWRMGGMRFRDPGTACLSLEPWSIRRNSPCPD